jgi:cysteinyl-tRNA synthetase
MSKSLKNFITVESFLQGTWTSSPSPSHSLSSPSSSERSLHPLHRDSPTAAADLRIFFLQHKYHSALYFSETTLREALNWRVKIESMLQLTHRLNLAPSTSSEQAQRMTVESSALSDCLLKTKQEIHSALSDDFNTPAALSLLSKLSSQIESYYIRYPLPHPETYSLDPIASAREYVLEMITLFGLVVQETQHDEVSETISSCRACCSEHTPLSPPRSQHESVW